MTNYLRTLFSRLTASALGCIMIIQLLCGTVSQLDMSDSTSVSFLQMVTQLLGSDKSTVDLEDPLAEKYPESESESEEENLENKDPKFHEIHAHDLASLLAMALKHESAYNHTLITGSSKISTPPPEG